MARRIKPLLLVLVAAALLLRPAVSQISPWPAESEGAATSLASLDPELHYDLSGAMWNPLTRTLWVCRNGPGSANSRLWAIVEDGNGGFVIDTRLGQPGIWSGFGDFEGVTQADLSEDTIYAILEGDEVIREYDVSAYGSKVITNSWDTSPFLPLSGNLGSEGITFVPDDALTAAGFVDADGAAYTSQGGMGGLMLVGHQNGGGIFAFDLDRTSGTFDFVGEYRVFVGNDPDGFALSFVNGLEFDRSTNRLYAWHGFGGNYLSALELSSSPVAGHEYRMLHARGVYNGPSGAQYEGLALVSREDCDGGRHLFLTIDDGGPLSLLQYRQFSVGCGDFQGYCTSTVNSSGAAATINATGTASISANDLTLIAQSVPQAPGIGIFIAGPAARRRPFFSGFLCLAGAGLQRISQVTPPVGNTVTQAIDYTGVTTGTASLAVVAGEPFHFQYWFRDPSGPGGVANLTDGLVVYMQP